MEGGESLMNFVKLAVDSLYRAASAKKMKSRYVYKKIASELTEFGKQLSSIDDLRSIKNVGSKTIDAIQRFIDGKIAKEARSIDVDQYCDVASVPAYRMIKSGEADKSICENANSGCVDVKKSRVYIPGYRTGGYAILKALWMKEGSTKHGIAHIGRHYCDVEFDFVSRYSAWTSMKMLINKGLVYREGKSRFYLTCEGKMLCTTMFANTSIVEEPEDGVILVVDTREIKSKKSRTFFQEYFESRNVRCETRVLEVGDFVWICSERLCGCIIERKRGSDFVSSIADGRLKEQKARLLNSGIARVFYVVEGLRDSHMKSVGKRAVMSQLMSTKLGGFTVIETQDIMETCLVICEIDGQIRQSAEKSGHWKKKSEEAVGECRGEDELEISYGSFIENNTKAGYKGPEYFLYIALLSIRGISHQKANAIAKHYMSIEELGRRLGDAKGIEELRMVDMEGKRMTNRNIEDVVEYFVRE
ncbi:ERCC4 domain-containing protein [Ordospora pajunii]|uniref:ERCC4 domain-containing protein n=1 Tax=Ordospora pajunii TaxID=3039483 RepID=UPI0029528E6F|nr:ERCC4 domain-containing protein [Ordospora pajunii]KAH9411982.1 ERCC4 domain-containing protein [Ordospora pajunii]